MLKEIEGVIRECLDDMGHKDVRFDVWRNGVGYSTNAAYKIWEKLQR